MRVVAIFLCLSGCNRCGESAAVATQIPPPSVTEPAASDRQAKVRAAMAALEPLQRPLPEPEPGDWLAEHQEPGQTFRQWLEDDEVTLEPGRRTIVVQPIGGFSPAQRRIVNLTSTFLGLYFGLPVVVEDTLSLEAIPDRARRTHPTWGDSQILTGYVLHQVLVPRFPRDAAVVIALTATDLWPGRGWNFVFGQALPSKRVGIWSIYRFGDPEESEETYRKTLLRSLKVATHEAGHMLGMSHCTAHDCNMCGSNHLEEADRSPLWLCNECVAKVWWVTGVGPASRFERLGEFCSREGLGEERRYYERAAAALD